MLNYIYYFSVFIFFIGVLRFCIKRKHLLLILLNLEFIVLALFFNIFIYLNIYRYEYYFSMIFLTIIVCEGVLGLSILVSLIRTHGNDYFQNFNLLW